MQAESALLECPGCGAALTGADDISFDSGYYGVLRCECWEYPVVAGVPIIMKGKLPDSGANVENLRSLIAAGHHHQALLEALTPRLEVEEVSKLRAVAPGWLATKLQAQRVSSLRETWRRRFEVLCGDESPGSAIRLIRHYFGARGPAANYFAFRAGQPKYLVTLAVSQFRDSCLRSLDIGCGAGHITRALSHLASSDGAVGVDSNFFLLWLANSRVSPNATFVCCDVERGLPFRDSTFDFLLLSNFYHFLYEKRFMLAEAKRAGREDAMVVVSSLRNANVETPTPNLALSIDGYSRLINEQFRTSYMFAESKILDKMILDDHGRLPLPDSAESLHDEAMINLLLSDAATIDVCRSAVWLNEAVQYRINPLYRRLPGKGEDQPTTLQRRWPSKQYIADNPEMPMYLPHEVEVPAAIFSALNEGRVSPEMAPLIRTGTLVDLPASY